MIFSAAVLVGGCADIASIQLLLTRMDGSIGGISSTSGGVEVLMACMKTATDDA